MCRRLSDLPAERPGGWGFMVLTNMLPNQGNGTYQLFVYAHDREGRTTLLGTRTMTCDNANATKPFGAIDTPTQGGTASGTSYRELRVGADAAAEDDSVRRVDHHGARRWQSRSAPWTTTTCDRISRRSSPGFQNTTANGAVGFRILDTTTLTNGLHTISWVVSDNLGRERRASAAGSSRCRTAPER